MRASDVLLVAWLALLACAGCKERRASKADCAKMIERYLDMSIASDPQLARLPPEQAAAVREVKRELKKGEKTYRQVQDRCEAEVTRKEFDCAMESKTAAAWEACIH